MFWGSGFGGLRGFRVLGLGLRDRFLGVQGWCVQVFGFLRVEGPPSLKQP